MTEKKYYWLKLKEDFFRQKEIKKLRKIAGGDTYTIIYLKMQLLSLKNEGFLFYEGTEETFEEQLALEIDEEVENVKVTILFLFNNNLMQRIEDNEFFMYKASECIGKEGKSAERVRRHREKQLLEQKQGQTALQCNDGVTNSNTEIEKELDIEKERELDTEKEQEGNSLVVVRSNVEVFKHFEKCGFLVSSKLMEFIAADIKIYSAQWMIDAANECVKRGKTNNYGYLLGILQNWKTKGRESKENTVKQSSNDPKPLRFNNFEARQYDYDDLEKKLLGWDN